MSELQDDTRPVRNLTDRFLLSIGDHKAEGAELEEILFDPDKLLLSEVVAIEKVAQLTWPQVIGGLNIGAGSALQAVIWVMRKRKNPKLKLTEVELNWGEVRNLDPDYRPEYGGIPLGAAFGDDPVDESSDEASGDDTDEGEGPKGSTTPPLPDSPGAESTNAGGQS